MRLFESCDPVVVQDQLMSIAGRSTFTVLKLGNQLQRVGATIVEPASEYYISKYRYFDFMLGLNKTATFQLIPAV
jgi:hypothetical protein